VEKTEGGGTRGTLTPIHKRGGWTKETMGCQKNEILFDKVGVFSLERLGFCYKKGGGGGEFTKRGEGLDAI